MLCSWYSPKLSECLSSSLAMSLSVPLIPSSLSIAWNKISNLLYSSCKEKNHRFLILLMSNVLILPLLTGLSPLLSRYFRTYLWNPSRLLLHVSVYSLSTPGVHKIERGVCVVFLDTSTTFSIEISSFVRLIEVPHFLNLLLYDFSCRLV